MIVSYISLLLFVILFELFRRKKVFIDFLLLFNLFFVFMYLFPAIIFQIEPEHYADWRFLSAVPEAGGSFFVFLAILTGYLSLLVGFHIGSHMHLESYPEIKFRYTEGTQFKYIALPFFTLSFGAFALYAYGHGGVIDLFLSGKEIRTGKQSAGFFQYFGYFASGLVFSMLLFFGYYRLAKNASIRKFGKLFLIFSLFFALINAIGTAGRGNIGAVFLMLFFFWLNMESLKLSFKKIIAFMVFSFLVYSLVTYGKSIIWTLGALSDGVIVFWGAFQQHRAWYVGTTGQSELMEGLIAFARNVDHGLVSVYLALHNPEIYQSPRLFFDWPRAFLEIIPGIIQPEFIVSSTPSALNRDYLREVSDGYVPPGWVAMKIINGGVVWLALGTLLAGFIGGWLERLLILNWAASPMIPGFFLMFAYFWKDYLVGPDPFMFVMSNLSLFLLVLLVLPFIVFKKKGLFDGG